jgi:2Fe-2S ferredoxin
MKMERFKGSLAKGERLLDRMLDAGIALEHDCGGALACSSCRVIVREGAHTLSPASETSRYARALGRSNPARLACQAVAGGEVVVEVSAREVPARTAGSSPVSVSARAAAFLAAQLARHPAAVAARLAIEPSGCSGFSYRIDPADSIREDDTVFESGGVRIAVDRLSLPYLQGATVDLAGGPARRLR